MSQHSKQSVAVYSAGGRTFTTLRGGRRLLDRGLAFERKGGGLMMIEADHRYNSPAPSAHGPEYREGPGTVTEPAPTHCADCHKVWEPTGDWGACEALEREHFKLLAA